ncbi:ShlB/FhaC/HecB family hemolysin secretion/activation protein [Geobacter sulfurreducens]|jgi:hemolysin activation/secretion protein|uniref:ShlB/FhaC/HecB family hemolysin secretion/activation protein n=1 Tax=Geobacter sulfurreducens TaxID=35554 RepID=UPI001BDCD7DF|nr:POTRA domain-containing protein [Geobacter sulfurreducens]QVW36377.1 ShlB/FhaC/HecB family hemolysin secretion/activation protein [Geobacter sulfurreducens]UTG93829.1 ShlB/FhaC/HecB family hemolysin secretion/activation protein [Geobacter sulfurreducens]
MKTTTIFTAALLACLSAPAHAQDLRGSEAGAVMKRESDVRDYYELQQRLKESRESRPEEAVTDRTEPAPQPPADGGQRVFISHIVTDPSEILTEDDLRQVVAPLEGKEVSIRELLAMVDRINDLYRQKGYLTARAVLPPQKVERGTVRIRLVEGRVGRISVEGNRHTRDWFVTSRLHLREGDLVRLDTLENDLFRFNAINDVKLRAEVKPGTATGTTDLILRTQEPDNYRVVAFADNGGGRYIGQERLGLTLQDLSLLGIRDPLTVGGTVADGTLSAHASYSLPLTPVGTRLGVTYDYTSIWITSGPFESLDVDGTSSDLGLTLSQPFALSPALSVTTFAGFNWKKSTTDFGGDTIFENRTRTLTLGGDLLAIDGYGTWFTRHVLTQGFHDFGGDRSFFKYNGDLVRTFILPDDFSALVRASGQVSGNHLLPSSEQFQLGGIATVRGFYEGLLIGDDGYFVSAELTLPLFPADASVYDVRLSPLLRGAIFFDHGGAFPYKGSGESIDHNDFLSSAGFGFILNLAKYLTGRIDFGFPVGERDPDPGTVRVHFSLSSEIL